jgi:hypothetical protein
MIKKLAAVIVLVLVVCTFAGCTTTTNSTNQTSSATSNATSSAATTHDAFFEKYLAVYKNMTYANSSRSVTKWELTWINNTSVHVEYTSFNKTTNSTYNRVQTIMMFPTSQDATNFVNAINKTAYVLASTQYPSLTAGAYGNLTGHAPQIYKVYVWQEGNQTDISAYTYHEIKQVDNIVFITTEKAVVRA